MHPTRVFKITAERELDEYKEEDFKLQNSERTLETLTGNSPSCLWEDEDVMVIGRHV
jgi:hypothetical protein